MSWGDCSALISERVENASANRRPAIDIIVAVAFAVGEDYGEGYCLYLAVCVNCERQTAPRPSHMASVTGAHIIARSLRDLGVTVIFGIVGIPVVEIAEEAINLGIRFIGFRNEQAASYAASAYGYLTGRPGVCLVVGGPGVLHAMAGVRAQQLH